MGTVSKHFVVFYSPGTIFNEESSHDIESWDVAAAVKMSGEVVERYGAKPFGFRFSTRSRGPQDLDSKMTAQSPMHYLGGKVRTLADVEKDADPAEEILLSNMRCNNIARVITNTNSWKHTSELKENDVVLPTPEWAMRQTA